jgi:hypothetical protein
VIIEKACRFRAVWWTLVDANSGITQQQAATGSNSQRSEVKALRQQAATGSKFRQLPATRPKPRSPETARN